MRQLCDVNDVYSVLWHSCGGELLCFLHGALSGWMQLFYRTTDKNVFNKEGFFPYVTSLQSDFKNNTYKYSSTESLQSAYKSFSIILLDQTSALSSSFFFVFLQALAALTETIE